MYKKSQVWTIEFILSFLIFTAAIILSVKSIFSIYSDEGFLDLQKESEHISQQLISEGFPLNWDNESVIKIGLLSNNKIDSDKLKNLYYLQYSKAKYLFGIHGDFFIYFSNASGIIPLFYIVDQNISLPEGCGYGNVNVVKTYDGKCNIDTNLLKYSNMLKISRVTSFNSSLVELNILIWNNK
ncbi:MAG: hypothetical protein QXL18_04985 [Candidatus Woesearchaeota archaeon]